jgi:hypothetical protein
MIKAGRVMAAALLVTGAGAQAQTPAVGPGANNAAAAGAEDTSRTATADRDQQLAYDNIRDEVMTTKRMSKRQANRVVAATPADLTAGAVVMDVDGMVLGTIEALKPDGVQLTSGTGKAMVPADVFGKKAGKLVLNVKKAEFEQQVGTAPK